ncbi:unnamed protein product [Adineta ricciae]|uniref:Uncharacterized protein n=1 Tax=Adineta ricciae TaxID=249248 RepID=A0A815UUN5_ADIRI|nr:unnamed protein product [Adineta ricciae]CAF1521094.1 unnamed protein product [Adineta ricciae]
MDKITAIDLKAGLHIIEKHPYAISALGVALSIIALKQSISDRNSVNRVKQEYENLLKMDPSDFATLEKHIEHITKRTKEIRDQIIALKEQQLYSGVYKAVGAIALAPIAYFTGSSVLMTSMTAASLGTGLASIINFYNCYELGQMIKQLEQNGLIV